MTRNERILKLVDGGSSYAEAAASIGCTRGAVSGVVWRATNLGAGMTCRGVERRRAHRPSACAAELRT